jgi:putative ABC transport system permease protein
VLKTTLRGLLAHKLRLLLAGFAVVLGVAFISGTYVLGDTINHQFDQLFRTTTAGVDVYVQSAPTGKVFGQDQRPPIPESVLGTVQHIGGVHEVEGQLARLAPIITRDGKVAAVGGAPSLAFIWDIYPDFSGSGFTLRSGSPPKGPTQAVIDAHTASTQHFNVGDQVSVELPKGGVKQFTVSGITGFGSQDTVLGASIVVFDPQYGQELLDAKGEFDILALKADSGVSSETLKARVAQALPSGLEAITGSAYGQQQTDQVANGLGVLTTFLLVFAFISVFVGSYIILNTFSILIAQRTRELALLRCLCASRAQVMRSVLLEATITGLVASVIGLALGLLIAKGLEALLSTIGLDVGGASLQFQARTAIVGLLVGIVVTIVASVVPARRATRVAPVEALRDAQPTVSVVTPRRIAVGLAVLLAGVVGILLGLLVLSSHQLLATGLGALGTFVGVSVLAPIVVVPVVSVLAIPVRRWRGVPGELARENAMRQPRRTAATASALMIGVALVSCFIVAAASLTDSINKLVDNSVKADFIVSPQSQTSALGMPPDVASGIAADSAVAIASPVAFTTFHTGNEDAQAQGVDPRTITSVMDVTVKNGAPLSALGDGDLAVSEDAAKSHNWNVGDTIPLQMPRPGVHQQRLATIYGTNALLGSYLLTRSFSVQTGIQVTDFLVLVKGRSGVAQSDLRARLTSDIKAYPALQVQDNSQFKSQTAQNITQLLNILIALVGLAIIIALLGVVNTMALSILERTRELGLIRALGMTRSQTRSMVRWETVLITLFGAVLGVAVGIFFGVALMKSNAFAGLDIINVAWVSQIFVLVFAFIAGVIAAWRPARRAARVDMLQAIVTE